MIDWAPPCRYTERWRTGLTPTFSSPFGCPSILLNGETQISKIAAFAVEKGAYLDTVHGRRYCVEITRHVGPQMMTLADIGFWL